MTTTKNLSNAYTDKSTGHSADITHLMSAIMGVQLSGVKIIKEKLANTGKSGTYKYADLPAIYDSVLAACEKEKIAFAHFIDSTLAEPMAVITLVVHIPTGEWMRSRAWFPPQYASPQAYGGVVTYLRKYSVMAMLGLAPEDDDAQGAEQESRRPINQAKTKQVQAPSVNNAARFKELPEAIQAFVQAKFPNAADGFGWLEANKWDIDSIYVEIENFNQTITE